MMKFLSNPIKYWWQFAILAVLAIMFAVGVPVPPLDMEPMATSTNLPPPVPDISTNANATETTAARQQPPLPPPPMATAARQPETPPATMSAAAFFPVFPLESTPDTPPRFVPVASSHPLSGDHAAITRAVVIAHDFSRDAGRALAMLMALAGNQNAATIILAPQFLLESDISRYAAQLPDKGRDFLRWAPSNWNKGSDSLAAAGQKGISSFTVMDLLLLLLGDREQFPNLTDIVVAGHGEGGDFAQRYAAAGQAPDILAAQGIPLRFVAANSSSYLFMTAARPRETKPREPKPTATTVNGAAAEQENPPSTEKDPPTPPAEDPAAAGKHPPCAEANLWPYGLDGLNAYAKRTGGNAIKLRYPARKVSVLIGDHVARNDPAPDTSCAALAQGADRLSRAKAYAAHLQSLFGDELARTQTFRAIPGVGYDALGIWGSACGMTMLFGDGQCGKRMIPTAVE